jgi:tetratricopeptide (TPR) repeat protein
LLRKPTRSPEAEPLYRGALASCVLVLGAEHPETAQSLNNLALLYAREGRYEQAEPLYQRALAICEKRLGAEHPHTRAVQANYTRLLQKITDEQAQQPTPLNPKNTVVC